MKNIKLEYKKYLVKDIPKELYKTLYGLNFRENGEMQKRLGSIRNCGESNSYVVVAFWNNLVVGWAGMFFNGYSDNSSDAHYYVRKIFRGNGIATELNKQLLRHKKKIKNVYVYTHDNITVDFFAKIKKKYKCVTIF